MKRSTPVAALIVATGVFVACAGGGAEGKGAQSSSSSALAPSSAAPAIAPVDAGPPATQLQEGPSDAGAPVDARATEPPPTPHVALHAEPTKANASLERVLATAEPRVTHCYEAALAKDPAIAGKLALKLFVNIDGTIAGVSQDKREVPLPLADCVAASISKLTFDKAPNAWTGTVTIDLTTK